MWFLPVTAGCSYVVQYWGVLYLFGPGAHCQRTSSFSVPFLCLLCLWQKVTLLFCYRDRCNRTQPGSKLLTSAELDEQVCAIVLVALCGCGKYLAPQVAAVQPQRIRAHVFCLPQEFLLKEEYRVLEYNLTTTEVELVNVSASWDEVRRSLIFISRLVNKLRDTGLFVDLIAVRTGWQQYCPKIIYFHLSILHVFDYSRFSVFHFKFI